MELGQYYVILLTALAAHLTLPYLTLPYLTLPYLTLPYLTLPYLALPLRVIHNPPLLLSLPISCIFYSTSRPLQSTWAWCTGSTMRRKARRAVTLSSLGDHLYIPACTFNTHAYCTTDVFIRTYRIYVNLLSYDMMCG